MMRLLSPLVAALMVLSSVESSLAFVSSSLFSEVRAQLMPTSTYVECHQYVQILLKTVSRRNVLMASIQRLN
jgi:hypothetical protein